MKEKMSPPYRYLFGPVPSRRMGLSLGIDLTPPKTCSYDCIYCQLGRTTHHTIERREWVPLKDVLAELERWYASGATADILTLAGSGEPTLHTGFGEVLRAIKRLGTIPCALLTNGSLLHLPEVRRDACEAAIVKVTLSVSNETDWQRIHRPAPGLYFRDALGGLRALRQEYKGELWIEVMLMGGTGTGVDIRELAEFIVPLRAERVQINTPVRPPADSGVCCLSGQDLENIARLFGSRAEVIGHFKGTAPSTAPLSDEVILALVLRHPCTSADVATALGLETSDAARRLERLTQSGQIRAILSAGSCYYGAPPAPLAPHSPGENL
ncbi:MAG TPA: radical SAM protein [Candidatus Sumerlaeota bacterium]|nr:radical SAM protein [Candidatus Sumerlaeota bacterium]HPS02935.1 radical SAM protein [Candidatus Sumerlaeota bacterium]